MRLYEIKKDHQKVSFKCGRDKATSAEPIIEALHQLLLSYPRLKRRLDKTKLLLRDAVKPESMTSIEFLR